MWDESHCLEFSRLIELYTCLSLWGSFLGPSLSYASFPILSPIQLKLFVIFIFCRLFLLFTKLGLSPLKTCPLKFRQLIFNIGWHFFSLGHWESCNSLILNKTNLSCPVKVGHLTNSPTDSHGCPLILNRKCHGTMGKKVLCCLFYLLIYNII